MFLMQVFNLGDPAESSTFSITYSVTINQCCFLAYKNSTEQTTLKMCACMQISHLEKYSEQDLPCDKNATSTIYLLLVQNLHLKNPVGQWWCTVFIPVLGRQKQLDF